MRFEKEDTDYVRTGITIDPVVELLNLLVDQSVDVFRATRACDKIDPGGLARKTWTYRSVLAGFADHGYSHYEWGTYVDLEILSAAMVAHGNDTVQKDAFTFIDSALDELYDPGSSYGLFERLNRLNPMWPKVVPARLRLRFVSGLIGRIVGSGLRCSVPDTRAAEIVSYSSLSPIEARSWALILSISRASARTASNGWGDLLAAHESLRRMLYNSHAEVHNGSA